MNGANDGDLQERTREAISAYEAAVKKDNTEDEHTRRLFEAAAKEVETINMARFPEGRVPELITYHRSISILLSDSRTLSAKERSIHQYALSIDHPAIYYSRQYNAVVVLAARIDEEDLVHELQHALDARLGVTSHVITEMRAYATSRYVCLLDTLRKERKERFIEFCKRAIRYAGLPVNFEVITQDILLRSVAKTGCSKDKKMMKVIRTMIPYNSPFLNKSSLAGVVIYPLVCKRELKTVRKVLRLLLQIHKRHGKRADAVLLERYCGIKEVKYAFWKRLWDELRGKQFKRIGDIEFLPGGFLQETAKRGDYRCESLQKRAIECLEEIARGE